jgi:hypothetical protein
MGKIVEYIGGVSKGGWVDAILADLTSFVLRRR